MREEQAMTWYAHQRAERTRSSVLQDVMAFAETRRDGHLPWTDVAGTQDAFGTPADLLGALQMRWHARLSGAIERELTEQPWDLPQAVLHAWRALRAEMPGVRAILDAHADEEAMQRARRKEWVLLASASGLSAVDDPTALRIGRQVEERARAVTVVTSAPAPRGGGWFSRIRHALAA
jgi:hypothetical protein